jgi:hypothetical protein
VRLIVPYLDGKKSTDAAIIQLADFLGISSIGVSLDADFPGHPGTDACLVIHSSVIESYCNSRSISARDFGALATGYAQLLVYGLRACEFDTELVKALSSGRLHSIQSAKPGSAYSCSLQSGAFCGPFAGLTFGKTDAVNDRVMVPGEAGSGVEAAIAIDEKPFVAIVKEERTTAIFIASGELTDLDMEVGKTPLAEYFSRFVPWVMALRYLGGENCWHPLYSQASVIVDDPLLRKNYGFLNFKSLLAMAESRNFHAALAFIPHNFRRSASGTVKLFLENPTRLSICFHGNDHTGAEFASPDSDFLNVLLENAEARMKLHQKQTGLTCDPVMVFPQGKFSIAAMDALSAHNFYAAVNTEHQPLQDNSSLTLRELVQPAVLRYKQFPLFLRKSVDKFTREDIAFDAYLGRPVLIGVHHQDFKDVEPLLHLVDEINRLIPQIQWSNLATVVSRALLFRKMPNQCQEIGVYARAARIDARIAREKTCLLEWRGLVDSARFDGVLANGAAHAFERADNSIRVRTEIPANGSAIFSLVGPAGKASNRRLDVKWKLKAFVRRRLSEFRDDHLYRNPWMLQTAKAIQHRVFGV